MSNFEEKTMDFIHRPYQPGSTIAAIASPLGEGGVAVIRISGKNACAIAATVFSGPIHQYSSHTAHFGKIRNAEGVVIDEVLCLIMRAPKSYTGEDTVEIQCHGGSLITRKVLEAILEAGAHPAEPGEFTFKAFMNGKLDLAQAEAVQELIGAKNELSLAQAEKQLQGALSKKIASFQKQLVDIAAILNAWVDFPEEGLEFASCAEVIDTLTQILQEMDHLSRSFHHGTLLSHGISLCLAGRPNVGKSSLMNALAGKDRAIVTPIAGTTRDIVEEDIRLGALHFRLVDTAGIRNTEEIIEKEGIRRSLEAMDQADLILLVLDASSEICQETQELISLASKKKTILVWNKIDLHDPPQQRFGFSHYAHVSAKACVGIDQLKEVIDQCIWSHGAPDKDAVIITKLRHKQALDQASQSLHALIQGLKQGLSAELICSDMHQTLRELGTIIGTDITEDILHAIFSKFCIGK